MDFLMLGFLGFTAGFTILLHVVNLERLGNRWYRFTGE
jgi:hypothetical protein